MSDINYEKVLEKIARASGLSKEEIGEKVKAKRAKLSELISYEGAAQIVAAELGINFENEKLKINELLPGMRKVNVVGKIIDLFPVRTFKSKKGEESKVVNFVLADDTSNIKIVLWDTNHISLIEGGRVKKGSSIELGNASMRGNELHLGSFSELKISSELFDDSKIVTEKIVSEKKISNFVVSENVKTRAFILQTFEPKSFQVCPECSKKATATEEIFSGPLLEKVVREKEILLPKFLIEATGQ